MTNIGFPLQLDHRGRTTLASDDTHIRELIEQVLFTAPGERVNRPNFGCGLQRMLFAPASEELVATAQFVVQGALQQWLGELIDIEAVDVKTDAEGQDGNVVVTVQYRVRRTQERRVVEVSDVL